VVLAILDKTAPSVFAALDVTLRRLGGAPTYVLTDNEKTVTIEHVAGMAVRNPATVGFARHYSVTVHTCEPADPASKGGSESTVKLAKADLVPKDTNLREEYASFAELEAACEVFCETVNARVHRVTRRAPIDMLVEERARRHPLPAAPHTVSFGVTRTVGVNTGDGDLRGRAVLGAPPAARADRVGAGAQPRRGGGRGRRARRGHRAGRARPPSPRHPGQSGHARRALPTRPRRGAGADTQGR
jgi:hypothetical protein